MPDVLSIPNGQIPANYRQIFMVSKHLFIEAKGLLIDEGIYLKYPNKDNKWFAKCEGLVCQGKDGKCTPNVLRPCECNGGQQNECPEEVKKRVCFSPM